MKITKRQLRRIIKEALSTEVSDRRPFPKSSQSLPTSEEKALRKEYEVNPDSDRYKRVVYTSMADSAYGTRGSVILDQQENVHLMFTYQAGSGGSLGS
tara:strand:+ start:223 stop:516 length:294 start_codon:yes stop_codon:yes gene_type:complete